MHADSPAALQALRNWSSEEDRQTSRRPASLLCRALLRGMLAEMTQSAAGDWRFSRQESGRPVALHQGRPAAPAISLSHSGSWVACAASFSGDIGIDIEEARAGRDLAGIAARAFGPRECAAVDRLGPARFYAIWTLREAIAKATGLGLQMAADGSDRVHDGPSADSQWATVDGADWWLMHAQPAPALSLALALRPSDTEPRGQTVQLNWWPGEATS